MCTSRVLAAFVLPPLVLQLGGVALAQSEPLVAVEFGDLRGQLTIQPGGAGGTFTAGAVSEPGLLSWGRVWRGAEPAGEALFDTGFVGEVNPADAVVDLTLGQLRDKRAPFTGTSLFTDVDGDTIALLLSGVLTLGPGGHGVAEASIDGIQVMSDEIMFDGSDGGSVDVSEFEDGHGTLRIVFDFPVFQTGGGQVHGGVASLSGEATGPRGGPVPAPSGAVALGGAWLLTLARSRRRPEIGGSPW